MGSVLLSALLALGVYQLREHSSLSVATAASKTLSSEAFFPTLFSTGASLLLLTALLYVLSATRSAQRLPVWVSDALTIGAGFAAIFLYQALQIKVFRAPATDSYFNLKMWATPLTVLWVWFIARMTAALNRVPQVTGGYLGIVALTFLLLMGLEGRHEALPYAICASLAGAGLASVPLALSKNHFNIGWSASLAMGFLLAQSAAAGLLKNAASVILLLSLLTFGLPLLDVSFFRMRAALRGKRVAWEETRMRLYEALLRRGLSAGKIATIYLVTGASLCLSGTIVARFVLAADVALPVRLIALIGVCAGTALVFLMLLSLTRILMRRTEDEVVPEDIEAFGVRISPVSMAEAIDKIEGFIRERGPHHVVTSDANAILRAQEDVEYAGIMRRAHLITPDGYGVIWGARLLNLPIYERVTGVDMVTGICEKAAQHGFSIYILGSAPGIASTAAQKLLEKYPGMRVAGTQHGFYEKEGTKEEDVVARIREAKPDVLFVAFGIPKQEKFIARHLQDLDVPVCLGVGGSFDVYSEKLKRAPSYIQRSGLEWLYRVWQEPWRWKRMSYVPRFMAFALREWLLGGTRWSPVRPTASGEGGHPSSKMPPGTLG